MADPSEPSSAAEASRQRIAAAGSRWQHVLGVSIATTADEVKKAFRKLALLHHPDKGGDTDTFKRIQQAYEEGMLKTRIKLFTKRGTNAKPPKARSKGRPKSSGVKSKVRERRAAKARAADQARTQAAQARAEAAQARAEAAQARVEAAKARAQAAQTRARDKAKLELEKMLSSVVDMKNKADAQLSAVTFDLDAFKQADRNLSEISAGTNEPDAEEMLAAMLTCFNKLELEKSLHAMLNRSVTVIATQRSQIDAMVFAELSRRLTQKIGDLESAVELATSAAIRAADAVRTAKAQLQGPE